jgi:hypothetical protein
MNAQGPARSAPGPATQSLPAGNRSRGHDREWLDGYTAGWDAGARSRPTRPEIEAWCAEQIERAYAAGYADGLAVSEHRTDARALTSAAKIGMDRARPGSGYIPRRTTCERLR